MATENLYRLSAFADGDTGGNPAGVWIGDQLPDPVTMQSIAADVGFSETAFIAPANGANRIVRYFSPQAEVSFCGHATIASGVVLGQQEGEGTYTLSTMVGDVEVTVTSRDGRMEASLISVDTRHESVAEDLLHAVLVALDWIMDDVDLSIPPAKAFAGAWHFILAVGGQARLANLNYDFEGLR